MAAPRSQRVNTDNQWDQRASMARLIRVCVAVGPALMALAFGVWVRSAWPPARAGMYPALWLVAVLAVSIGIAAGVERLARRLTPLAMLLKMSLIFPDQAPSRFKMAMRSGTTRKFQL
ncbi:MAG: SNF family Na+-dependent transporter [Candidatus Poriferisodalaceae bacterium]|jgi:SNF family Na+-dependent transporter